MTKPADAETEYVLPCLKLLLTVMDERIFLGVLTSPDASFLFCPGSVFSTYLRRNIRMVDKSDLYFRLFFAHPFV
jgi:hypothetical protein